MSDHELTRWADSEWVPLVRGQRVTVMHGGQSGDYLVTGITPGSDGSETYHLEPVAEAQSGRPRGRQYEAGPLEHHGRPLRRLPLLTDFSGEFSGTFYPGAAERLLEAIKSDPRYCKACEGFPCQGGHPPDA